MTDQPLSLYAATKKSNEAIAYSFSQIYNIKITALRFFTVYGPYGRPDMAFYNFAYSLINNKEIELFNNGNNLRDYTYIDDVVSSIKEILNFKIKKNRAKFEIINICSSNPVTTKKVIKIFESYINKKAKIKKIGNVTGDVFKTYGNSDRLRKYTKRKFTNINIGIRKYIEWFNEYY